MSLFLKQVRLMHIVTSAGLFCLLSQDLTLIFGPVEAREFLSGISKTVISLFPKFLNLVKGTDSSLYIQVIDSSHLESSKSWTVVVQQNSFAF